MQPGLADIVRGFGLEAPDGYAFGLRRFQADPGRFADPAAPGQLVDRHGTSARIIGWIEQDKVKRFLRLPDRKSVVEGKRVSVRVDLGGRRIINKKNTDTRTRIKVL